MHGLNSIQAQDALNALQQRYFTLNLHYQYTTHYVNKRQ